MNRREFLKSACVAAVGATFVFMAGGCVAPRISPTVSAEKSQAWRCEYCGHLTRSSQDLSEARCPRCMRTGHLKKITEKELQAYLKQP